MMPVISVIIPIYNSEKTIRETIDSVLNQSFADFELIVINDGSSDSSLEIISNIEDDRIKVFSYPNAGISVSRNRGISHAQGEFIAFLDHDDLWTSDKLELQLKALQENPQAAVAYSWVNLIDESSKFLRQGSRLQDNKNIYGKLLLMSLFDTASNPLIRRSALIEVGGFDESIFGPEDWDIFIRIAARYDFVEVYQVQVLYRQISGSASSNVFRQETECLKVIERSFDLAPDSLQVLKKYSIANLYKYLIYTTLNNPPTRERGLACARFIWPCIKYDPAIMLSKVFIKVLLKMTIMILVSTRQAEALLAKFNFLSNTNTILNYRRTNPY